MTIIDGLRGEHGAMYPLLEMIEKTAASAGLLQLKAHAVCLQSTLSTHARLEDELLRPALKGLMPPIAGPSDHEIIDAGLNEVLASAEVDGAARCLLDTVAKTREHFLKEETVVFQKAMHGLSHARQEELGAEWARMRGVSLG